MTGAEEAAVRDALAAMESARGLLTSLLAPVREVVLVARDSAGVLRRYARPFRDGESRHAAVAGARSFYWQNDDVLGEFVSLEARDGDRDGDRVESLPLGDEPGSVLPRREMQALARRVGLAPRGRNV